MNAVSLRPLEPNERADLLLCVRRWREHERTSALSTGPQLAGLGLVVADRTNGRGQVAWRPTCAGQDAAALLLRAASEAVKNLSSLARLKHELSAEGDAVRARAPHVATRVVVDSDGEDFVRELYVAFDTSNRVHFDGALAPPLILKTYTAPRALGDHTARDAHGLRSVIRLHPKTVEHYGMRFAQDILLHEMVHTWQFEVARDDELGYRGHGPKFAEQCNGIGARLGLPPVGLKGRKGLPDCAQWPVCVRPSGYYGNPSADALRDKRAAPRPPKPPAAPAPGIELEEPTAAGSSGAPAGELVVAAAICDRAAHLFRARRRAVEHHLILRAAVLLRELAAEGV
jgi:SprT-like family